MWWVCDRKSAWQQVELQNAILKEMDWNGITTSNLRARKVIFVHSMYFVSVCIYVRIMCCLCFFFRWAVTLKIIFKLHFKLKIWAVMLHLLIDIIRQGWSIATCVRWVKCHRRIAWILNIVRYIQFFSQNIFCKMHFLRYYWIHNIRVIMRVGLSAKLHNASAHIIATARVKQLRRVYGKRHQTLLPYCPKKLLIWQRVVCLYRNKYCPLLLVLPIHQNQLV